jgi:pimeloyl-ACP methyl ester carboxylesterase
MGREYDNHQPSAECKERISILSEVTVNGQRLFYKENNGGFSAGRRTLVFIHGSGGSHEDWNQQIISLKNEFNIAALDLPGHGQSEGSAESDVFSYVDIIEKFLKAAGILKPVLIGHSLGAAICLGFAIRYRDVAAAIVPVGGGVKMPVNPLILDGIRTDPDATIAMISKFSVTKTNREQYAGLIIQELSRVNPEIIYNDFTACNRLDITEKIPGIAVPTLVICGSEDKMTPPAFSEYLSNTIPGARLALIPEAGHFVMLENPKEFNDTVADFAHFLPTETLQG